MNFLEGFTTVVPVWQSMAPGLKYTENKISFFFSFFGNIHKSYHEASENNLF